MKKTHKKKLKPKIHAIPNGGILGNTILSSIIAVVLITVGSVLFVMFMNSSESIKSIEDNLPAKFIQSLSILNKKYNNTTEFIVELPYLQKNINEIIHSNYQVKDIVVTDNRLNVLYTSIRPEDGKFAYNVGDRPETFRLVSSSRYNVSNYRTIHVKKEIETVNGQQAFHIHLIIPKGDRTYSDNLLDFTKKFCCIVLFLSIVAAYFLAKSIQKPLENMEETISKISQGDLSGRLEYTKFDEINQLVQSYNMMVNALQRLYSTLEMQVQERTKELNAAYAELQSTQAMMVHSEKMKSLGELVAGIMHEINNPINFIYGNMIHLNNYSNDLIQIIDEYEKVSGSLKSEENAEIEKLKEEIDYEFLKTDLPDLIKSCKEGAERAKNIIQDLKSFSRMEEATISGVDIPHEIDLTLNILYNKLKNKVTVHKEYIESIPKIEAFGGQLNQVFMNILDNAAGAIEKQGDIWIRINADEYFKNLIIEIEDNGVGMDKDTASKVFNPFFTTKPVGQGTGLGMSITYKIIKNHQGDIVCKSKKGKGTKFIITLPINIDRENLNAGLKSGGING